MESAKRFFQLRLAGLVRKCLLDGVAVPIDGLGVFRPCRSSGVRFVPSTRPRAFIAYVEEDFPAAQRLFRALAAHGFDPWLDRKKLLPGQNWPRSIERAIEISDFFLACFSRRACSKRGHFQAELRYALDCASRLPLDQVYLIPVRLEECAVPRRIVREIQYVDLFPDWEQGVERIVSVLNAGAAPGARPDHPSPATAADPSAPAPSGGRTDRSGSATPCKG